MVSGRLDGQIAGMMEKRNPAGRGGEGIQGDRLNLHFLQPVLQFKVWNAPEVLLVICHQSRFLLKCGRCNKQISIVNQVTAIFQCGIQHGCLFTT